VTDPCTFLFVLLFGGGHTLEYADLYGMKIIEHPDTQTVQISAHSHNDKIDEILSVRVRKRDHAMWLVVKEGAPDIPHPFIHKNNPLGRAEFDCTISVSSNVQRIIFGRQKTVLWTRSEAFGQEPSPADMIKK
jgi:hypothetical protein